MDSGRRVLKALMTFPYTWAAVALVLGTQWGFTAWFSPTIGVLTGSVLLAAVLLAGWWYIGTHSNAFVAHLYKLPKRRRDQETVNLEGLRADLNKVGSTQGAEQLELLTRKLETVREILTQRLSTGELTFARYIGVAEQVYLNAVDNLREIYVALTAVGSIDAQYIDGRIAALRGDTGSDRAQNREIEVLEERKKLLEDQLEKVSHLIVDNEAMMTALDNTASKLADAKINLGHATMDADTAMSELVRLAEGAKQYES